MASARGGSVPKFGRALAGYRAALSGKRAARSLTVVARRAAELGHSIARSTISRYEKGRPPDVGSLWVLSRVYGQNFDVLIQAVLDELWGRAARLPAPAAPALTPDELTLLGHYRSMANYPLSQRAMLGACRELAKAPVEEAADAVG